MIVDLKDITAVDIIVIRDSIEFYAIRAILESLNIQTRTHYIGNVRHLMALLQKPGYLYKTIIICCHGDAEGLLLPELSAELEKNMPFHKRLNSSNLLEILDLDAHLVINTGCCLGREAFAQSFLAKGVSAYIGATCYIEASTMLVFIVNFAYFYFAKNLPRKEAFNKARFNSGAKKNQIELWER